MISIIIPTYEREAVLESVIYTYLKQKHVKQLIILDDASKCKYKSVIDICSRECKCRNIEFVYYKNAQNKGAAYCRNKGLELATEEYILWGEDDLYLDDNYTDILLSKIDKSKAICGTIIYDVDIKKSNDELQKIIAEQQEKDRPLFDFTLLEGYYRKKVEHDQEIPFGHAILLVPKSAYENVVYYEGYTCNGYREESDAQVQMLESGYSIFYTSDTKCFHLKREKTDKGGQHSQNFITYQYYKIRNNNIFINRHYPVLEKKFHVRGKFYLKFCFASRVVYETFLKFACFIVKRILIILRIRKYQ